MPPPFVDIHCHLLPGIDDGAKNWDVTLAMARMAVDDGTQTIIVTPHQLGNFVHNLGDDIRARTAQLQQVLTDHEIPLEVLPGGDVRIEDGMVQQLISGEVLTLADRRRHVLLELPHELYFPLEGLLRDLKSHGMVGILSHPERNHGILTDPDVLPALVEAGCLMQVTAGSLMGTFGGASQQLARWMLTQGLIHFLATDAHSEKARRPLLQRAFQEACSQVGEVLAVEMCCDNPRAVAHGETVLGGRRAVQRRTWRNFFSNFFSEKKVT